MNMDAIKNKILKIKNIYHIKTQSSMVALWLRIWSCHCCGLGHCWGMSSIPGPRTSACHRCSQKKKKKKNPKNVFDRLNRLNIEVKKIGKIESNWVENNETEIQEKKGEIKTRPNVWDLWNNVI